MGHFKKMKVIGDTKEEAFYKTPFEVVGDSTLAYNSWKEKQDIITDADLVEFMKRELTKKTRNIEGGGLFITIEPAIINKREFPYDVINVTNTGKREYKTVLQLIDDRTGVVLAETDETKKKALELAKQLYVCHGYTGNLSCIYTKQVVDNNNIGFKVKYSPTKGTRPGTYYVFGIEKD